ncbi:methyltransferase domain-containing protein [Burkholderiaceae bacterium DAT-1]|nr:methyltransferase domain-containing protein [Burkholderiaceae bacterium DAT-1]
MHGQPTVLEEPLQHLRATIDRGEHAHAESGLRAYLQQHPDDIAALDMLGDLLALLHRDLEAAEFICRAFLLKPETASNPKMRGLACYVLGRKDEAIAIYRDWLAREPDNPVARHMLAACSGDGVPTRATSEYVSHIFDEYAPVFDQRLRGLGYCIPEHMRDILAARAAPDAQWDILDGGCGTGLLGPLIRPWCRTLTGVDLSEGMLDHAEKYDCYDTLHCEDLERFLADRPEQFDIICIADTLIYFGDLRAVLHEAFTALHPGGTLMFNTERCPQAPNGYLLEVNGRFKHASDYVRSTLAETGFTDLAATDISIRSELGVPVSGELICAIKPAL